MERTEALPRYLGKLWVGGILASLGLTWSCVGIGMALFPRAGHADDVGTGLANLGLAAAALLVPGAVLVGLALRGRRRSDRLQRVAALGAAAVRMPIDTVAQDLGVTPSQARGYLLDAVALGLLTGRIDLEHGTFLSTGADAGAGTVEVKCRACGASATAVALPGRDPACPFCGARV